MENKLILVSLDSHNSNVTEFLGKHLESLKLDDSLAEVRTGSNFITCLEELNEGKCDALVMNAVELHGKELDMLKLECRVNGAITPRRASLLLISENKINYQPKSSIILCDHKLIRRQLRRSRKDLRVLSTKAFISINNLKTDYSDEHKKILWMEEMKNKNEIGGYVTSRVMYDNLNLNGRRHALLPDPKEGGGDHFLPLPYSDLIIFLTRKSSPQSITKVLSEREGETIWWIQNQILGSMEIEELSNIGILVRHRRVKSLMEEAEKYRDLTLEQACHNAEGEVLESEVHVEVKLERISKNGKRTISIHRVIPYSKFEYATISLIRDWEVILREVSQDVPQDFVLDKAAGAFINLQE